MASPYGSDNMNESLGWPQVPDVGPFSGYQPENFSDVNSSSVFEMGAPTIVGKEEPTNNGWEMYQDQADLHPDCGLGIFFAHGGFVQDIHPIQTVLPASIKDEPLSGISDASSIISPATTDSASPQRIHCSDPFSLTHQRKRSSSDCTSCITVGPTRQRSSSDAFSSCQTIPGAEPPYGDFLVSSSYLPVPEPANHYLQTHLTPPQSNIWPRSHSHPGSTCLPGQFGTPYDYSSMGSYDGHGQGCLPTEDVIGNGQTSITGGHFKAQVASPAVQKAAWKKRKNFDGRIFGCRYCGAHLTTKQNLTYHISAHLGKREYACGKCPKRFTTPHVRTRHEIRCRNQEAPNV